MIDNTSSGSGKLKRGYGKLEMDAGILQIASLRLDVVQWDTPVDLEFGP